MARSDNRIIDKSMYGYVRAVYEQSDIQIYNGNRYVNLTIYIQVHSDAWRSGDFAASEYTHRDFSWYVVSTSRASGRVDTSAPREATVGWQTIATINTQCWQAWLSGSQSSFVVNLEMNGVFTPSESGLTNDDISQGQQTIPCQTWNSVDPVTTMPSFTTNSSGTIVLSHSSTGNKNTFSYSIGSYSGTIVSASTATSISWTPPRDLCYAIPNSSSGTVTISQTTYDSNNNLVGTATYNTTLNVESYSLIASGAALSVTKKNYTSYSSYVAGKTVALVTLPSGFASDTAGYYGSTITAKTFTSAFNGGSPASVSDLTFKPGDILEAGPTASAGTLNLTFTVTDSRGRSSSITYNVTYVANASVDITSVTGTRSGTSASGTITGTFNATYKPLSITANPNTNITISAVTYSGNNFTYTYTATNIPTGSSKTITFKVTDGLGNSDTEPVNITSTFAYFECSTDSSGNNPTIAIGKATDTNRRNVIQIGKDIWTYDGAKLHMIYNGSEKITLDPANPPIYVPSYSGQANKVLTVNSSASGLTWSTPASPTIPTNRYRCISVTGSMSGTKTYDSTNKTYYYMLRRYYADGNSATTPSYCEIFCLCWPAPTGTEGWVPSTTAWSNVYCYGSEIRLPNFGITFDAKPDVQVSTTSNGFMMDAGLYYSNNTYFGNTKLWNPTYQNNALVCVALYAVGPYTGAIV